MSKEKQIPGQWNQTEPRKQPTGTRQRIVNLRAKAVQQREGVFSTMVLEQLDLSHVRNRTKRNNPDLTPYTELKMDHSPKCKPYSSQVSRKEHRKCL